MQYTYFTNIAEIFASVFWSASQNIAQWRIPSNTVAFYLAFSLLDATYVAVIGLFALGLILTIRALSMLSDYKSVIDKIALAQVEAYTATTVVRAIQDDVKNMIRNTQTQEAKLDQIHTLVNSNMSAAMENELDARKSSLASLQELASIRKQSGAAPSTESMASIESNTSKIAELEAQLRDRKVSTDRASEELKKQTAANAKKSDEKPEPNAAKVAELEARLKVSTDKASEESEKQKKPE